MTTQSHVQYINKTTSTHKLDCLQTEINKLQNTAQDNTTGSCFDEEFWSNNFTELCNRETLIDNNDKLSAKQYLSIQGEAILLRSIEIGLIKKLQQDQNTQEEKFTILQAFQNSAVYEKYFGTNGLETKLKKYRQDFGSSSTLETIVNKGESTETKFKLPDLKVEGQTFASIYNALKDAEDKLVKNLESIKITQPTQLNKLTQATLMADPITMAIIIDSQQGKMCMAEIESGYKKQAIENGLWIVSVACTTAIVVILTPQLTAALGTSMIMSIAIKIALQAISIQVSTGATKLLKNCLEKEDKPANSLIQGKLAAIDNIKIDNKTSDDLLNELKTTSQIKLNITYPQQC